MSFWPLCIVQYLRLEQYFILFFVFISMDNIYTCAPRMRAIVRFVFRFQTKDSRAFFTFRHRISPISTENTVNLFFILHFDDLSKMMYCICILYETMQQLLRLIIRRTIIRACVLYIYIYYAWNKRWSTHMPCIYILYATIFYHICLAYAYEQARARAFAMTKANGDTIYKFM